MNVLLASAAAAGWILAAYVSWRLSRGPEPPAPLITLRSQWGAFAPAQAQRQVSPATMIRNEGGSTARSIRVVAYEALSGRGLMWASVDRLQAGECIELSAFEPSPPPWDRVRWGGQGARGQVRLRALFLDVRGREHETPGYVEVLRSGVPIVQLLTAASEVRPPQ